MHGWHLLVWFVMAIVVLPAVGVGIRNIDRRTANGGTILIVSTVAFFVVLIAVLTITTS